MRDQCPCRQQIIFDPRGRSSSPWTSHLRLVGYRESLVVSRFTRPPFIVRFEVWELSLLIFLQHVISDACQRITSSLSTSRECLTQHNDALSLIEKSSFSISFTVSSTVICLLRAKWRDLTATYPFFFHPTFLGIEVEHFALNKEPLKPRIVVNGINWLQSNNCKTLYHPTLASSKSSRLPNSLCFRLWVQNLNWFHLPFGPRQRWLQRWTPSNSPVPQDFPTQRSKGDFGVPIRHQRASTSNIGNGYQHLGFLLSTCTMFRNWRWNIYNVNDQIGLWTRDWIIVFALIPTELLFWLSHLKRAKMQVEFGKFLHGIFVRFPNTMFVPELTSFKRPLLWQCFYTIPNYEQDQLWSQL